MENFIFFFNKGEYGVNDLVEAPKMVDKAALQIGYAKTAKKVDMKKIKEVTWNILTQASSEVNIYIILSYTTERFLFILKIFKWNFVCEIIIKLLYPG